MRKSRTGKGTKSKKPKGKLRKYIEVSIGTDNEFDTLKQSVLADLGDTSFIPRMIRLVKMYGDRDDNANAEESFWNHTAKVVITTVGGLAIGFGAGILIPFGYILKILSGGSNTKLWLQQHPEYAKKLKKDKSTRAKLANLFVNTVNTVTITTNDKGGVGKVIENVAKQE